MNILETLYFPDTAIFSERQYPLFLLFPKVNLITLIETDETSREDSVDSFMYGSICQVHTPAPLGEDKDRFLYLINDIKNRKDDYAAQLGQLTLASMSRSTPRGEDAKHQIMSKILGHQPDADNSQPPKNERIWHARLVLKIAEILDTEQEDVAKALIFLEDSEADLFDRLKGGSDADEADSLYNDLRKIKAKLGTPSSESMGNRLSAWFRFSGAGIRPACPIWTTTRSDAAAILFENHTRIHNAAPASIVKVPLPSHIGSNCDKDYNYFNEFSQLSKPVLQQFSSTLLTVGKDTLIDVDFTGFLSTWNTLIDSQYPKSDFGRIEAEFFLFNQPIPRYSGNKDHEKDDGPMLLALISI